MLLILGILIPSLTAIFTFDLAKKYLKTPFILNLIGTALTVCNSFVLLGHFSGMVKLSPEQLPNGLFFFSELAILVYMQPSLVKLYDRIFEHAFSKMQIKKDHAVDDGKEYAWSQSAKMIIILLPVILTISLLFYPPEIHRPTQLEGIEGGLNEYIYIIKFAFLFLLKGGSILLCLGAIYVINFVRPSNLCPKWLMSDNAAVAGK